MPGSAGKVTLQLGFNPSLQSSGQYALQRGQHQPRLVRVGPWNKEKGIYEDDPDVVPPKSKFPTIIRGPYDYMDRGLRLQHYFTTPPPAPRLTDQRWPKGVPDYVLKEYEQIEYMRQQGTYESDLDEYTPPPTLAPQEALDRLDWKKRVWGSDFDFQLSLTGDYLKPCTSKGTPGFDPAYDDDFVDVEMIQYDKTVDGKCSFLHQACVVMTERFLDETWQLKDQGGPDMEKVVKPGEHWCIDAFQWRDAVIRDWDKAEGLELICDATDNMMRENLEEHLNQSHPFERWEYMTALVKINELCGPDPRSPEDINPVLPQRGVDPEYPLFPYDHEDDFGLNDRDLGFSFDRPDWGLKGKPQDIDPLYHETGDTGAWDWDLDGAFEPEGEDVPTMPPAEDEESLHRHMEALDKVGLLTEDRDVWTSLADINEPWAQILREEERDKN